jgi:hypothetical protein
MAADARRRHRPAPNGRPEGIAAPQAALPDGGFTFVVDRGAKPLDLLDAVALLLIDLLEKAEASKVPASGDDAVKGVRQTSPGPSPRSRPGRQRASRRAAGKPAPP